MYYFCNIYIKIIYFNKLYNNTQFHKIIDLEEDKL